MTVQGVVHMHSTVSYDGKEKLEALRDFLVSKGISFCCMTEHTDKLTLIEAQKFIQSCKALTTSSFTFIPGFEVPYLNAHILIIGTEVFLGQVADATMLRDWSSKSALTVIAHPVRSHFKLDEVMEEVIDAVEIWNQQYDGKLVPRTRSVQLLKKLLQKNKNLLATGGLDFHRKEHFGAPVYTLEVESLTSSSILNVLKNGAYTFGSNSVSVSSRGTWVGERGFRDTTLSLFSITTISAGKLTNKLLAKLGIKLPKSVVKLIRKRI
jgi:hypothetical protein